MSEAKKKFYLTTPIYYVNARPHIGHAYTTIVADVIARRHRLLGDETYFLTGTDEHGQKIERSAAAAGIPPQQFADQVSASFENLWKRMGITHDQFIRTTSDKHKRGVQKLFTILQSLDKIYLSSYTGQYSIGEEMFIDGPPGTIGPDGKPTETVTEENYFFRLSEYQRPIIDLIESGELSIQPEVRKNEVLSFLCGDTVGAAGMIEVGTPSPKTWGLTEFEISEGVRQGKVERSASGRPYVPGALKDLSISRSSFKWGVPVPNDEKHVIYVWLDALANYMTAVGYGSDDPIDIAQFEKYWPADLHLVGKEIIRFHCVYWPAFLLAAGLPLPKAITAHGWLLFEDSKMSKSRGNIVRTETILDAFGTLCPPQPVPVPSQSSPLLSSRSAAKGSASPEAPLPTTKAQQDLFAADILRYFLLREIPFGQDGSFSFDALVQRYNSDLANGYGNLVSRTLTMVGKYFAGVMPSELDSYYKDGHSVAEKAQVIGKLVGGLTPEGLASINSLLESLNFSTYIAKVQTLVGWADEILSLMKPWKERDTEEETLKVRKQALYQAGETIRIVTGLLYPVMPYATAVVWQQLGLGSIEEAAAKGELSNLQWGDLKPGTKLGPLAPIFPRAPKELIQQMTDMENPTPTPIPSKLVDESTTHTAPIEQDSTHPAAPPRTFSPEGAAPTVAGSHAITTERPGTPPHHEAPASALFANAAAQSSIPDTPQIAIDDFVKIDLRVAQIIVAERIPKADKLLRLEVDLGYERRQILSGIAEWYTPEELIGRRIVVIANLAPRKMRGLESHGMLLAASNDEPGPGPDGQPAKPGKPILATFGEDIALGSRLR